MTAAEAKEITNKAIARSKAVSSSAPDYARRLHDKIMSIDNFIKLAAESGKCRYETHFDEEFRSEIVPYYQNRGFSISSETREEGLWVGTEWDVISW